VSKETELWLATDGNGRVCLFRGKPIWRKKYREWVAGKGYLGIRHMAIREHHPLAPSPGAPSVKVKLVKA